MSNISDYAEKLLLDWLLTGETVTRPTSWFVALFTSSTDDAGSGTELSGNGYTRLPLIVSPADAPGGTTGNANELLFTAAGGSWDTLTHIGIYDAEIGGNLLWQGALNEPTPIPVGESFVFLTDSLDFTLG